jgi:hypothetical protein
MSAWRVSTATSALGSFWLGTDDKPELISVQMLPGAEETNRAHERALFMAAALTRFDEECRRQPHAPISMDDPLGGYELPYEDIPGGPVERDVEGLFVDQCDVEVALADGGPLGRLPLLILQFRSSVAEAPAPPPLMYVAAHDGMRAFQRLVNAAVQRAVTLAAHRREG